MFTETDISSLEGETWFAHCLPHEREQITERLCHYLKWVVERNPTLLHVSPEELTGFFLKEIETLPFVQGNLTWYAHVNEWIAFHLPVADQFEMGKPPVLKKTPVSVDYSFVSATPNQLNYLQSLAKRHRITLPTRISKKQATQWIDELKTKGTISSC